MTRDDLSANDLPRFGEIGKDYPLAASVPAEVPENVIVSCEDYFQFAARQEGILPAGTQQRLETEEDSSLYGARV
jgi:hypothetical protein